MAGFGLLMTLLILARGGGYLVVVPRLAFVVPLAVVGTVTVLVALGAGRYRIDAVGWLGVVVVAGFAWNFVVYWLKFGGGTWDLLLLLAKPTGIDFRDGVYRPAEAFSTAVSGWPPLTLYLGRPFTLLDFPTAYLVQVGILVALALVAAALSAALAGKAAFAPDPSGEHRPLDVKLLAVVMGLWLVTSYGFMFEVERGNIDLYALVFALLAVWYALRSPKSAWPSAVLLAVAIGLKLYPAILVVILVWRYKWRALLPLVVSVAAVMLAAGPANLRHSFATLDANQGRQILWWGNHSSTALAHILRDTTGWAPSWIGRPLLLVPCALWVLTLAILVKRGWSDRHAVVAAAASVPLMGIVPSLSNDYRLVLCVFPLAVLVALIGTMRREPEAAWVLLFGVLALAMMLLARSSLVVAPSLQGSKYALLVLLQGLLLAVTLLTRDAEGAES